MTTQAVKNIVVNIELKDFPVPGREMVILNEDGSYTILLNSKLTHSLRQHWQDVFAGSKFPVADTHKNNH